MRILVISNLFPPVVVGGYERECGAVVEHLRPDHDVLVLTSSHRRREAAPEAGVERLLPLLGVSAAGSLRAPVASLRAAALTRRAIARFHPELIYVWNGAQLPVSVLITAGRSNVPVAFRVCEHWFGHVFTSEQFARHLEPGSASPTAPRGLWGAAMRLLDRHPLLRIRRAEPFPASISWNSDFLRRSTPIPANIEPLLEERIYPALPQGDRFAAIERRPSEEPTIAFVGRVNEEKGILVALEALALLRGRGTAARLLVAGPADRPAAAAVAARIEELGLGDAVELLGELDEAQIAGLLARARVMLVPPVWEEPAGLVCVEAALARVPLVASRSGGIPELMRDREEALLFEIGDAAACAELLAEALEPTAESEARVERAYRRGRELSFGPYAEATDRFLGRTMAAFAARAREAAAAPG